MRRPSLRAVSLVFLLLSGGVSVAADNGPGGATSPTPPTATADRASAGPPAAGGLDLAGYIQALDRLRPAVEGLSAHPQDAAALRGSLPHSWNVEVSGQRYDVSTGWLAAQLTRIESNAAERATAEKEILARLDRLRAGAVALTAPAGTDLVSARAAMQEILSGREYSSVHSPSWLELAWARILRAVGRLLGRLFSRVGGSVRTRNILSWLLIGGSFLLMSVLLVRWLLRAMRRTELARVTPAVATAKDWRQWAQEALAAGGRGEFRGAVHACYWAAVGRLESLDVWTTDQSRTPREYLHLLDALGADIALPGAATRAHPAASFAPERIRAALVPLTGTFERVWYAGVHAIADDFRLSFDRLEELGCRFPSNRPIAAS